MEGPDGDKIFACDYTCWIYVKWVWDMSQTLNTTNLKLSDFQYTRFQILAVHLQPGLLLVTWYPHCDVQYFEWKQNGVVWFGQSTYNWLNQ